MVFPCGSLKKDVSDLLPDMYFAPGKQGVCSEQSVALDVAKLHNGARACSLSCAPSVLRRFAEVLQRTVPFVYFLLKKIAEIFGGFKYFL